MDQIISRALLEHQCEMERFATEYSCRDDAERLAQARDKQCANGSALVPCWHVVSARGSRWVIERRARSDWRLLDIL
jgi:hypothetical protein